jgi:hypothetical protein
MSRRMRVYTSLSLVLVGLLLFGSGSALAGGNSSHGDVPLEKARQVLEERLADVPGFAGIAHSTEAGEIIVFLENDHAKGMTPVRFDGFPVRQEVVGTFYALPTQLVEPVAPGVTEIVSSSRQDAVSPLVGGISLSAYVEGQHWAGTLGMVTYDNRLLSNAHVLALDLANNVLPMGTPIVQPGSYDGGTGTSRVGALERYIPIKFKGKAPNYADAAIATLDPGIEADSGWQFDESGDYQILGTTTVSEGDTVRKSGRTTGTTTGEVYLTNASAWVDYGFGHKAYFVDQVIVLQPFIDSGDSGSAVDKQGSFVGLVFAGSDTHAIVCKASHIVDGLGIALEPRTLESMDITPKTASIAQGGTQQFTATGKYSDGSTADLTTEADWTSDPTAVATVDALGLATGVGVGTATITATLDGFQDSTSLTVADAQPTLTVSVATDSPTYRIGGTVNIVVTVTDAGAPVEGAFVDVQVITGKGAVRFTDSATTGGDGRVDFRYMVAKRDGTGTYTVIADASHPGYEPGTVSTAFVVSK